MTANPTPIADGEVEALRLAYEKVALWPENRMSTDSVLELGEGFADLLALRNLIPCALARLEAAAKDRRDALKFLDQRNALRVRLTSLAEDNAKLRERVEEAERYVGILLANIRQIEEATGEGPEGEDAQIVDQIERDHETRARSNLGGE